MRRMVAMLGLAGLLAACSPTFASPDREVIVVPPGSTVVCPSGRTPPC